MAKELSNDKGYIPQAMEMVARKNIEQDKTPITDIMVIAKELVEFGFKPDYLALNPVEATIYKSIFEKGRQMERERIIKTAKSLYTYGGNQLSGSYNHALEDVQQALKGEANG